MDHFELTKRLQQKGVEPIYLFYGEERLLLNQAVETIRRQAIPAEVMDFNYERLAGDKVTGRQIVDLANTMPFMAERRVLVVEQPAMLSTTAKGESSKADEEAMLEYIDNPNPFCTLIFKSDDKIDKRKKLYKQLQSKAVAAEFSLLKGKAMEDWILDYVQKQGKQIERPALAYLSAMGSYTLEILTNELDKLILYAGDETTITLAMAQMMATKTVEANIFEMIDHIGLKKGQKALALLQDSLYLGEEPLRILALLVRHFRILLIAKDMKGCGYSDTQLRERLKLPPFVVGKSVKQANGFSITQLIGILEKLLLAEVEMKSSGGDNTQVLERLVVELCYLK